MGDNDKPFACPITGCNMRFANEDHLTVHKRKHDMSLNLTSGLYMKSSFVDQTPTPTRFILNCEEVGLFQDLNPFEEQFRRAAQAAASGQLTIPEKPLPSSTLTEVDTLNTPSIPQTASDSDVRVSTSSEPTSGTVPTEETSITLVSEPVQDELSNTMPFTTNFQPSSTTTDSEDEHISTSIVTVSSTTESTSISIKSITTSTATNSLPLTVVQTPVITSVLASPASTTKPSVTGQPTAVVTRVKKNLPPSNHTQVPLVSTSGSPGTMGVTTASIVKPTTSSTAAPVFQLVLKFPDGHSMPVQIPVVPVAPAPSTTTQPLSCGTMVSSPKVSSSSIEQNNSTTKLKLKQSIMQGQNAATISSRGKNPSENTRLQPVVLATPINNEAVMQEQVNHKPGRKRREFDEDPDEKRRKFLERNRAAATRCRMRRKQWVQDLEKKSKELSSTNSALQNEVATLRNEVARLKTMLLDHKDCPVTLQQQAANNTERALTKESAPCPPLSVTTFLPVTESIIVEPIITNVGHNDMVVCTTEQEDMTLEVIKVQNSSIHCINDSSTSASTGD
ncbi:cyclic AMP-dependent transcription factor ATF-2-like isoform X2 [Tachypleus tridentatus]|uniref:cyclic AMP-dependent transcription factor ATF-2-like isoform X2 n=2 Tax=Tachypleus tridentatus TaxID=6853 RepID=UPI003FD0E418